MYSSAVHIKSFGGQKGGSSKLPRNPPAYGPAVHVLQTITFDQK